MPAKKRTKKKPVPDEPAPDEVIEIEPEASAALGPAETTEDKGADEIWWCCPHCDTRYPKGLEIARRNHLDRVHNEASAG